MIKIMFMLLVSFSAISQEKVVVYDAMATERKLPVFTELQVEGGIAVFLSPHNKRAVAVSASDASYRDLIVTEVVGNRLKISTGRQRGQGAADRRLKVYVAVPTLDAIIATGASDIFVKGVLTAERLTVQLSGASDFSGALKLDRLVINQSGSSDVTISGWVEKMSSTLSGASDLKGFGCTVSELSVVISGASQMDITVNKELNVTASGASDVRYMGSGVLKKLSSSGASTVRFTEEKKEN